MIRFVMVIITILVFTSVATPSDITDGTVHDGYTYNSTDGYWWYNSTAYSREKISYTETVCKYGCYYQQPYYYYKYTKVPVITYQTPDWRSKLLDIAAARDKFEGRMRESSNEHNQFQEAVAALGLSGNFRWDSYGMAPAMAAGYRMPNYAGSSYSNLQLGNYGTSGNTIYGYSYSQLVDAYGVTDTNLLYQQAAALARNSQDLGGKATENFAALVEQAGNNKARVAEALSKAAEAHAKGLAAKMALEAASPSSSIKIQTNGSGQGVVPGQPIPLPPPVPNQPVPNYSIGANRQLAIQNCVSCHTGNQPKGGYDVTQHWNRDSDFQTKVVKRLLLDPIDPKFMPRTSDNKAGHRLPPELIMEFMPAKMGKVN